jgi:16S rRNA processing protein RimM
MPRVKIGQLGRTHGLQGEVTLHGCSLTPDELMEVRSFTRVGRDGETELTLVSARAAHDRLIVRFEGIDGRDQASALSLGELRAESDRLPDAGPGQAYAFQIIGLRVETLDGRVLGNVSDIVTTAANPVYVVRGEREILIPVVEPVVRRVDLERGVITVDLPAGLEDL